MQINLPIAGVNRPSHIAALTTMMSFAAWLCPSFGILGKGFTVGESLNPFAILLLMAWYLLIWLGFYAGQQVGCFVSREYRVKIEGVSLDSNIIYYLFTIISCIGCIAAYHEVLKSLQLTAAMIYLSSGQGNELKEGLYENYSVGFASLRYLVVYSASLSLWRLARYKKLSPLIIVNLVSLLLVVLLSSRLILMATLLTTFFILTSEKKLISINLAKLFICIAVIFSLLSVLNYSRNARFYKDENQSFWVAGCSEIFRYLGSPFQVEVGAVKVLDQIAAQEPETYRKYIDVEINLNTNSAFVALHEEMGYLSWPYIAMNCFLMGMIFSILFSFGKTVFLLPCATILYAAAELWRLDLFTQGIFIVWFVIGIGVPVSLLILRKTTFMALGRP